MNDKSDILLAIEPVVHAFDKLNIQYCIGGSVASSIYGLARSTMDVDILADLNTDRVGPLVAMLSDVYYIDENMILNAIGHRSSFNLIHLETIIKIDVFIAKDSPFDIETLKRKQKDTLDEKYKSTTFYFESPEDIILNKLLWFRMGGETSDRQWNDILGILKTLKASLDKQYLHHWSVQLHLHDLLSQAFQDAGFDG